MSEELLQAEALHEPELLERTPQILSLKEVYESSRRGHVRCAVLIGEEGIGKTRLFSAFRAQHIPEGEEVFVADFGRPDNLPIPARPVVLLLSQLYRKHGNLPEKVTRAAAGLEVDISTIQYIAKSYREKSTDDPLGQLHGTQQTFWKAITEYLHEHGRLRQINLLFENVEQGDTASIEFLEFFLRVRAEKGIKIFCCLTYRGDEKVGENPFQKVLPKIKKSEYYNAVNVPPLLSRCVPSFLASAVGRLQADDVVHEQAFKISRGNPRMLLEYLRSLAAKGLIKKRGNAWQIDTEGAEISALPEEMEQRLIEGAARLARYHRSALEWSSVVGAGFTTNLIGTLTGIKPTQFGYLVTDLVRDRYWDEAADSKPKRFDFPSPAVRKALYDQIAEKPRKKMHLAAAAQYEKETPPPASRLAEHYRLGENVKKERQWALLAGQKAFRRGDWAAARKHLERVAEISREGGKPYDVAEACVWVARVLARLPELAAAEQAVREGLSASVQARDAFADELRREQALVAFRKNEVEGPLKALKALHDAAGEPARVPELVGTLAELWRLKNRPARTAELLETIDLHHEEFPVYEGRYHQQLGRMKLLAGDWAGAATDLDRAEQRLRELRDFAGLARTLMSQAELLELKGQIPDALGRTEAGIGYAADYEAPAVLARLLALQSRLLQKQGRPEASQQSLSLAGKIARQTGLERVEAYVQLEIARWCALAKNIEPGLVNGRKALEVFERLPDREGGAAIYHALGWLYFRQRNMKHSGKYYQFAFDYYKELGAEWRGAFLAPARAAWAAAAEKPEQVQPFLDEGLALAERYELPEARGLILLELGKEKQDREMLAEAFKLLRGCGNKLAAARARKLLKQESPAQS